LHANVTEIDAPGEASRVAGLEVRTREGTTLRLRAQHYVLATGGIETARLLLCSDRHQPAGVGNARDVVGRYFMDHPRLRAGRITFRDPKAHSSIYDMHVVFPGGMTAEGTKVGAFFGLSPEVQRAERVGNTRSYVVSRFVGDDPQSYDALISLYEAIHNGRRLRGRRAEVAAQILRRAPQVAVLGLGLKTRLPLLSRGYTLETVVEPTPMPDSRVTLTAERDELGMRRVKVDWRVGELEKRTIRRTQEILSEELQRVQAGSVEVEAPHEGEPWPKQPKWCWHHMGTARMHADPSRGVVDANCRVHGMQNLFVAGSSVFPTCGSDMPTVNIVALSLRLAAHLKAQFQLATHTAVRAASPN
jgi:choline dehydrogenase-like flavoprotein